LKKIILLIFGALISILIYSQDFKVVRILSEASLNYEINNFHFRIILKVNEKYFAVKENSNCFKIFGIDSLSIRFDKQRFSIQEVTQTQREFLYKEAKSFFTLNSIGDSVLTSFKEIRKTYELKRLFVCNSQDSMIAARIVRDKGFLLQPNELLFKVKLDATGTGKVTQWPIFFFYLEPVKVNPIIDRTMVYEDSSKIVSDYTNNQIDNSTIIIKWILIFVIGFILMTGLMFFGGKYSVLNRFVKWHKKVYNEDDSALLRDTEFHLYSYNTKTLHKYILKIREKFYIDTPEISDEQLLNNFYSFNSKKLASVSEMANLESFSYKYLKHTWENENAPYLKYFEQFPFNVKIKPKEENLGKQEMIYQKPIENKSRKDVGGESRIGTMFQGKHLSEDNNKKVEFLDPFKDVINERMNIIEIEIAATNNRILSSIKRIEEKNESLEENIIGFSNLLGNIENLNQQLITEKAKSNQKEYEAKMRKLNYLECNDLTQYGESCCILLRKCQSVQNLTISLESLFSKEMNKDLLHEIISPLFTQVDDRELNTWIWVFETIKKEGRITSDQELLKYLSLSFLHSDSGSILDNLHPSFFQFLQNYLSSLLIVCQDIKHFDKLNSGFSHIPVSFESLYYDFIKEIKESLLPIGLKIQYVEIFGTLDKTICLCFPDNELSHRYKSIIFKSNQIKEVKEFGFRQFNIRSNNKIDYKITPSMEKSKIIVEA
jgi:hypothetical protein